MSFKSPKNDILGELNAMMREANTGRAYITISNDTFYTGFVEFGTSRMEPRAMVRRATPAIEKWMDAELKKIEFPTIGEIEKLLDNLKDVALNEIKIRTPVKTGLLRRSWEPAGPFYE